MLSASEVRQKYLDFFAARGHAIIPSAPLVPENDPTTLFTSSGMQPLIPYLLGEPHSQGRRLTDSQKCFRSQDIDEVGDNRHTTFFEMLGNWSLGDYFKKEQLNWFWEFLTKDIGLDPNKLYVSVFSGDSETGIGKDDESISIWQSIIPGAKYVDLDTEANGYQVGMQDGRIFGYGVKKNWWSRSGVPSVMPEGEPGGPDSEVFYDFGTPHDPKFGPKCHPNCDCGRFIEIGNSVFMQFQKQADGSLVELPQKNVDFGGGFSRIVAASSNNPDIFTTDLYQPIISGLETATDQIYKDNKISMRVIADHLVASVFLIADGVRPSNKTQGYFLRRLLRRAMVKMQTLKGDISTPVDTNIYSTVVDSAVSIYSSHYQNLLDSRNEIVSVVNSEQEKFGKSLQQGLKMLDKVSPFDLFQTYGFPIEVTEELYSQSGKTLDRETFDAQMKAHQDSSRTASAGMFKGGLQDHSEVTTKYHTATHLLHKALRDILGNHVQQKGSNITAERLRFDFSHPEKISPESLQLIEQTINEKILENLPVTKVEMPKAQALSEGAMAFFPEKYPEITSVYTIGNPSTWYSKELCGGPHVNSTGEIGKIKITKEESAGSGTRRIYAQLVPTP